MNIVLRFYRVFISPVFHAFSDVIGVSGASGCRFEPSCSCYCEAAIQKHGLGRGSLKSIKRILRCHPFSGDGGYDPV